ncbi:MAG: hypothetical protein KY461_00470 [Actinobacteria bacterium]|nr:hypothetical protein [Actinomycetota bacterium]
MHFRPSHPLRVTLVAVPLALLAACANSGEDQTIQPSPTPTPTGTATEPPASGTAGECSAGELAVTAVQPEGLTEAAAETWNDIRSAALACDYERLATIAGEDFTYSFGGGDDPATFWRRAEEDGGEEALATLVQILGLPSGEDHEGNTVWPRVHVEPEDDTAWEELAGVYDPELIASWRDVGGYLGYRTAITPDGGWLYFVAGD